MNIRKGSAWLSACAAAALLGPAAAPAGQLPGRPREMLPPPIEAPAPAPVKQGELPPTPTVAAPLAAAPTGPIPPPPPALLRPGECVTLRVTRVVPCDGFSPGERLLNGRPPIQPGDHFLAEVIHPLPPYPVLVGGTVVQIVRPGWFGKPGYTVLQMAQLVQTADGREDLVPWRLDLADQRFATRIHRILLTSLFGMEGAVAGATMGAQRSAGNMAFIGGGMGIGLLLGLGYASFQRGAEPDLQPGDTFEIRVGTLHFRPVPRDWQTILYPAPDPTQKK